MNKKSTRLSVILICSFSAAACTTVTTTTNHTSDGIPFYLPKPILVIKEPIEAKRSEKLFAVVRLGGLTTTLYEFDQNIDDGLTQLRRLLSLGNDQAIQFIPAPANALALLEETNNTTSGTTSSTAQYTNETQTETVNRTSKFQQLSSPPDEQAYSYKPQDISKSFEISYIPDTSKPFMLRIKPGIFGGKATANFANGWQLTSINAEMDATAALSSLTSLVSGFLTTQKDIEIAEISEQGKLDLEALKQQSTEPAETATAQGLDAEGEQLEAEFSVIGYLKQVTVSTIKPGIYDLSNIAAVQLQYEVTEAWQRTNF